MINGHTYVNSWELFEYNSWFIIEHKYFSIVNRLIEWNSIHYAASTIQFMFDAYENIFHYLFMWKMTKNN